MRSSVRLGIKKELQESRGILNKYPNCTSQVTETPFPVKRPDRDWCSGGVLEL